MHRIFEERLQVERQLAEQTAKNKFLQEQLQELNQRLKDAPLESTQKPLIEPSPSTETINPPEPQPQPQTETSAPKKSMTRVNTAPNIEVLFTKLFDLINKIQSQQKRKHHSQTKKKGILCEDCWELLVKEERKIFSLRKWG